MSRIIVKNLPLKVSENEILKHFSQVGPVTDVSLKFKKGKFRRFCFVGYEKEDDAIKANEYFQNSYLKQSKLIVELSKDLGAKPLALNEKPKARDSDSEDESGKKTADAGGYDDVKDDPEFQEYLQINNKSELGTAGLRVKKSVKKKVETDSNSEEEQDENENKLAVKKDVSDLEYLKNLKKTKDRSKGDDDDESDDESKSPRKDIKAESKTGTAKNKKWKELHTISICVKERGEVKKMKGKILTKQNIREFLKPTKFASLRIPRANSSIAFVGFKNERLMNQAMKKDNSFLDGKRVQMKHIQNLKPDDESLEDISENVGNLPWSAAEERLKKEAEPVAESGKIYVRNLWYSVTSDDLKELFETIGPVADVTIPVCKTTRKSKGFGHVTFVFPEHAVRVMNEMDGTSFKGRLMHILPSLKVEKSLEDEKEGKTFKEKKQIDKKASANSWHNWNSLFMDSKAVMDLMSQKYGVSKQEMLENENAAVDLALGEAQLVNECKRFLETSGVCLDSFNDSTVQRSSTTMLVKNLAANTNAKELKEVFEKFGVLGRIILPPSGVTGLVEFLDPGEAKKAFRSLAYSRFKHLPLYLEWAPVKVFSTESGNVSAASATQNKESMETKWDDNEVNENEEKKNVTKEIKDEEMPNPEENTTLYVKNLNFETDEDSLKKHFSKIGPVCSVIIAKRRNLSQGYGFVQYLKAKHARKALRELQDSALQDHSISIKLSEKVLVAAKSSRRKIDAISDQLSSKILVKNLPFHATKDEVWKLFKTFGEIKTVRLPLKPGASEHRGFGFVEFVTKEDAKKAFDSLSSSSHLYGRRLVLQWANEEESIDELRKKTADHFLSGPPTKRSRLQFPDQPEDEESYE